MTPYFVSYFLVIFFSIFISIFSFIENRFTNYFKLMIYFFIILSFVYLFNVRDYGVGKDTYNYLQIFYDLEQRRNLSDVLSYSTAYSLEVGFCFIVYWLSFLFGPVGIFNFFAIFIYVNFSLALKYIKINPVLYYSSFFTYLGFYVLSFNIIRQILAVSLITLAGIFLIKNKNKSFLILVLLGTLIHYSAFIFIFTYFMYKNVNFFYRFRFVVIVFIIVISKIAISFIGEFYERYAAYIEYDSSNSIGLILFFFLSVFIASSLFYKKINIYQKEYKFFIILFSIYIALQFSFLINGISNDGTNRLVLYFLWPLPFIIGILFKNISDVIVRVVLSFIFFGFMTLYFWIFLNKSGYDIVPFIYRVS